MDAGEKQLRQIFEKTTINNIKSIISYNQFTQEVVEKLEKQIQDLDNTIRQYDTKFENMQKQLSVLQTKVFAGGS